MRRHVHWLLAAALVSGGCEPGEVTLVRPDDAPGVETSLAIHVTLEDSALAASLGWADGVPGASAEWAFVQFRRYLFHSAASDSTGVIDLDPEGRGWHWVAAQKEVDVDGEHRVLGGGAKSTGSTELSLKLDYPGTLVISEVYMEEPPPWEGGSLSGSKYIEIYNNSGEVFYLDGMILGKAYDYWYDLSRNGHHSCLATRPFREDPGAVWSRSHWRFPGSGTEYPIAPGQAVVVAVSAADHTAVHPTMLDLADAEFEFGGGGQADNPAAANMENISSSYLGGQEFLGSKALWFLSGPLDVSTLPTMEDQVSRINSATFRGFPASVILDVVLHWWDTTPSTVIDRGFPPCEHPIHPRFDALPGGYLYGSVRPEDLLVSPQRRVVRTEDGRAILLDTNTSAVDFENLPRTPGWIPDAAGTVDGRWR